MADLAQLETALRNAHAAGDTAAASAFAQEIMRMRTASQGNAPDAMALMRRAQAAGAIDPSQGSGGSARPLSGLGFDPTPVTGVLDNVVGLDNGVQSVGERAATAINNFAEGATAGLVGDEANAAFDAAIGRGSYEARRDAYRQNQADLRASNPVIGYGSEIAGAVLMPGGAMARGGTMGARALRGAAVGAAQGGVYGASESEGGASDRLKGAATGAAFGGALGAAAPFALAGVQKFVNRLGLDRALREVARRAPTAESLRDTAGQLYRQADASAPLPRSEFAGAANQAIQAARREGLDPTILHINAGRVASLMQDAAEAPNPNIGFTELDILRRQAGVPAGNIANRSEAKIAAQFQEAIDDFVETADPRLSAVVQEARNVWGRLRRSEVVEAAIEKAHNQASGFENGIRVQLRSILNNPKSLRGFSDAEVDAMRQIVRGTPVGNLLRMFGKFGWGGGANTNALGVTLGGGVGAAVGTPLGASALGAMAVPLAGTAARRASEALTASAANRLSAAIRAGGVQPASVLSDATRDAGTSLLRNALQGVVTAPRVRQPR